MTKSKDYIKRKLWLVKQSMPNKIPWGWFITLIIVLFLFSLSTILLIHLTDNLPSLDELENPQTSLASLIKSSNNKTLDRFYAENRTHISYDEISPHIIHALITVEDRRFFDHWGVDMFRTLVVPYYLLQGQLQGGSTITQQLARNLYTKIGRKISVFRKIREMITAIQIEQNYTKKEIIELYLNTVEFPNSAFGIETAAQIHFGKSAKHLNILEAAVLIGSLKAIYTYNPKINYNESLKRRNLVLYQMKNFGYLDKAIYDILITHPIILNYRPPSSIQKETRYFSEYTRSRIQSWISENDYDLYRDGLTIYTTIDSDMQDLAEKATKRKLDSLQKVFEKEWTSPDGDYMDKYWETFPNFLPSFIRETERYKNSFSALNTQNEQEVINWLIQDSVFIDSIKYDRTRLEASMVVIEPKTGRILAWVGGSDYGNKQFDHVYQSRKQAGSTFKPFVYAVAIDNGYKPYHTFSKYPISYYNRSGQIWSPKDATVPIGPTLIPLRQALARSLNNITVRLLPEIAGFPGTRDLDKLAISARKIKDIASNLGIDMTKTPAYPSIALGAVEVSLLELVSAYTTFANQGIHIEPIAVTRIEDKKGNILASFVQESKKEVMSSETAYIVLDMMRGVIRGGKGYHGSGVRLRHEYKVTQDVAGKTGTTQNSSDNWFIALFPHMAIGAWVGGEDRRTRFPKDTYIGQGARTALPIVGTFISEVKKHNNIKWKRESFKPPQGFIMPRDLSQKTKRIQVDEKKRVRW